MDRNKMRYLKTYKLFESKSSLKFTKQPSKKGAKTETYNVIKDGEVIGQIKWSSRMRGYSFLPEKEHDDEIKDFIKGLMNKRKESKTNESFGQNGGCLKVLNDICLELSEDEYYSFFIDEVKGSGISPDCIRVGVYRPTYPIRPFTYDGVRGVFERMIEYMDSENFEILRFVYSTPEDPASHNWLKYQNGELMTYNREKVDRFHHLQIIFTEKEVQTNESIKSEESREMMIKKYGEENIEECNEVLKNIEHMSFEVQDLGITVLFGYTPMTFLCKDTSPKIYVSIIADERLYAGKIADIDIFKDTLLGYVRSLGFSTGQNTFTSDDRKINNQILIQK